jgi:hypothetical protein
MNEIVNIWEKNNVEKVIFHYNNREYGNLYETHTDVVGKCNPADEEVIINHFSDTLVAQVKARVVPFGNNVGHRGSIIVTLKEDYFIHQKEEETIWLETLQYNGMLDLTDKEKNFLQYYLDEITFNGYICESGDDFIRLVIDHKSKVKNFFLEAFDMDIYSAIKDKIKTTILNLEGEPDEKHESTGKISLVFDCNTYEFKATKDFLIFRPE